MLRQILWFLAICTVVGAAFAIKDSRDAARRRELWAEATD